MQKLLQGLRNLKNESPAERFLFGAVIFGVVWYVFLCLMHLLSARVLWIDEQSVFVNLVGLAPIDLFREPLQNHQVFPRVYLFLIQQFASLFDFHLVSVRLPSFLAMIAAFFIWLKIASYEFRTRVQFLTFVLCWSASAVLLYYSAELKPYSMDVLCGSMFMLFLYRQRELEQGDRPDRYMLILAFLPVMLLFSYPAYLFASLVFYNLLLSAKENRRHLRSLFLYTVSCLAFGLFSYFFDIRLRPVHTLTTNWGTLSYFISTESVGAFFQTFGEGTLNLFFRWFVEDPRILKKWGIFFITWGMLRMFYGFFLNIKRDGFRLKSVDTIALVLFVELVILGVLRKYPFIVVRTSLFFCPIALVLMIKGIAEIRNLVFLRGLQVYAYRLVHIGLTFYLIFLSLCFSFFIFAKNMSYSPRLW